MLKKFWHICEGEEAARNARLGFQFRSSGGEYQEKKIIIIYFTDPADPCCRGRANVGKIKYPCGVHGEAPFWGTVLVEDFGDEGRRGALGRHPIGQKSICLKRP